MKKVLMLLSFSLFCSFTAFAAVGDSAGSYYYTDIQTILYHAPVPSYNIGGRTCIVAEAMRDFGYTVVWDEAARTLTISKPADFYKIETDYGVIKTANDYKCEVSERGFWKFARGILLNGTAADGINEQLELKTKSGFVLNDGFIELVKLSDLCDAIGASCVMTETEIVGHSEWVNGIAYDTPAFAYSFDIQYDENTAPELSVYKAGEEEGTAFEVDSGVYYAYAPSVTINGAASGFYAPAFSHLGGSGASKTDFGIYVIDKEVYVPCFMAAELLGLT